MLSVEPGAPICIYWPWRGNINTRDGGQRAHLQLLHVAIDALKYHRVSPVLPKTPVCWAASECCTGMATGLFRARECQRWGRGVPTLWCPLLVGLSSAWWSRDVPHSCLRPSLPFAACSLGAAPSWLSSPGVPLNWEMWVLLPPRNGLRVVSLSSQITLKSVQIVNFRSFLELKLLQLTLLQPQKAIPLKRNYYYYTINPPKHTQRTWFRTRYRNNLSSLCGLEGWYLEQLVKQKCLAPGLALLLNDPLFMCHLSNPWRDR